MSLINQMLKDLEKRTREVSSPDISLSGLFSEESPENRYPISNYFIAPIILAIIFIITSVYIYKHGIKEFQIKNLPTVTDVTKNPTEDNLTANDTNDVQVSSAQSLLTGITLHVQQNVTYLDFLLNRDTYYWIETDEPQNKLKIYLDNTNLTTALPPLDYIGSAIKGMEISVDQRSNLIITLTFNDNTELKRLNLVNQTSGSAELQLDVSSNNSNSIENSALTSPKFTKQPVEQFNIEQQYKSALSYAELGEYPKSIKLLSDLVAYYPKFTMARESLISIMMQHGDAVKAKKILAATLENYPDYPPYIELQARVLINEGKLEQALDLLQRAAPPIAQNPGYHAMIAALYQNTGHPDLSATLYEQLIQLQPSKGVWWMGLGIALESLGKPNQAKEAYARANSSTGLTPELMVFIQTRMNSI